MRFTNLRFLMRHRRVLLWDLAELLKISQSAVSQRLNGRLEFLPMERDILGRYFGVKVEWLFQEFRMPAMHPQASAFAPAVWAR